VSIAILNEHVALADSVREVLEAQGALRQARESLEGSRPDVPAFWPYAVDLGWFGLHIGEEYGGLGCGLLELAVVVEQLGRYCAPGNFLSTVLTSALVQACGSDRQKARWLPDLAQGAVSAGIAVPPSGEGEGVTDIPVLGADAGLALVPVGEDVAIVETQDGALSFADGALDQTRALGWLSRPGAHRLDLIHGSADTLRELIWCLAGAEAVGGMRACLEMVNTYSLQRKQFDRLIGSFQAVKHLQVNLLSDVELATAAVWDACQRRLTEAVDPQSAYTAAAASLTSVGHYVSTANLSIQLLGAIGFTWEHDAHLYLRRAAALAALLRVESTVPPILVEHCSHGVRPIAAIDLPESAEEYRASARQAADTIRNAASSERQHVFAHSGYYVPHWPAPYGRNASPLEQIVIEEELADIHRPSMGLGEWILPTVLKFSTPDQRERWMWPSLEGHIRWCQLFSEPGAGSDAAAVSTKATRIDGGWLLNGQKVWNSLVEKCERGLMTVRTDSTGSKHKGITVLAVDTRSPGITVRPIREITGAYEFNEVFFDDVFVPDEDLIGEVDDGWLVARATFANERVSLGAHPLSIEAEELVGRAGVLDLRDPVVRSEAGMLLAEANALRSINLRHSARAVFGVSEGAEGNIAKLVGSEHAQRVSDFGMREAGIAGVAGEAAIAYDFLFTRCLTIAGGTSEIMRNLIGERFLRLPRER
jgi:3-oxochol-4-en-24-oyl-CoA dehydrogenase